MTTQVRSITDAVCREYGVTLDSLRSRDRTKTLAEARQVWMWCARELTRLSLSEIGSHFGRKHSTVLWAINAIMGDDVMYRRANAVKAKCA